jgi:4-amino-4-deoxy-L-arabinose transferase-like glycosyltransferase
MTFWTSRALLGALLVASLAVRARHLATPLVEEHPFRQAQTAITVWAMVDNGIRLFNYETPIFGPPWQVPFEFPIFQAAAALLVKAGAESIDAACRATNLFFFYLSAGFLYALCRRHFEEWAASACVLMAYVWMPFTIFWSRTAMIDYASVTFTLAYLYYLEGWVLNRGARLYLIAATGFGCLSLLTKPTTTPIVAVAIAWVVVRRLRDDLRGAPGTRDRLRRLLAFGLGLGVVGLLPLLAVYAWTTFADRVKAASPATSWLASEGLTTWTYGTWEQRAQWEAWRTVWLRMWGNFAPEYFVVFPLFGLVWAVTSGRTGRSFVLTMLLGATLTQATFFNLYVAHTYYQMAVSPAAAILVGVGLYALCVESVHNQIARWVIPLLLLRILYGQGSILAAPFGLTYEGAPAYRIGKVLQEATTPDERVIVEGRDWSADFLYYARRRGLMMRGSIADVNPAELGPWLKANQFTTVLSNLDPPPVARFWNHHRQVGEADTFRIYKVWD